MRTVEDLVETARCRSNPANAYTGAPFTVNREYAEASGGEWVILSAKYGFLRPTDLIPGTYEVTFKSPSTGPISIDALREQVRQMGLDRYAEVVGLGVERRAV